MIHRISIEQRFDVPIETVFAAITDHAGMSDWIDGAVVTVEEPGVPAPNGLGALRRIAWRGISVWERVVAWEEPSVMDYRVERGSPVRDHIGRFRLKAVSTSEAELDYQIEYRVPWFFGGALLGTILTAMLGRDLRRGIERLAAILSDRARASA